MRGYPEIAVAHRGAQDAAVARSLWALSAQLTRVDALGAATVS